MKEKIKLIIVFILGIMISVVISLHLFINVRSIKKVVYKDNKILETTSDPDYISGVYSSSNTLNNHITTLESYAKISTDALVSNNTSTAYTHASLKTAAGLFVTLYWNGYYVTQPVLLALANYHFVFDFNGTMYTAVVYWNKPTGTVSVSNRGDVYVNSIVVINN